jgi:hypothetical protein
MAATSPPKDDHPTCPADWPRRSTRSSEDQLTSLWIGGKTTRMSGRWKNTPNILECVGTVSIPARIHGMLLANITTREPVSDDRDPEKPGVLTNTIDLA